MTKKILIGFLIGTLLVATGCFGGGTIIEGEVQKYYVTDLLEDPNNRNILRSTTAWSEDAVFELLIPEHWEVKQDKKDEFNTDYYLQSTQFPSGECIALPGTIGYGIPEEWEKDLWYTTTPNTGGDDYYFYEVQDDGTRIPQIRIIEFQDGYGNYYIMELQYPESDYETCNADFSNIVTSFAIVTTSLEDSYSEEEVYQPQLPMISIMLEEDSSQRLVIEYPHNWVVGSTEDNITYLYEEEKGCKLFAGVPDRDLSEAAGYEEDVIVLDNNDMAKLYKLYDGQENFYMELISDEHDGITYNFELTEIADDACVSDFETIVKSFRTYQEELAAQQGIVSDEQEEEEVEAVEETQE